MVGTIRKGFSNFKIIATKVSCANLFQDIFYNLLVEHDLKKKVETLNTEVVEQIGSKLLALNYYSRLQMF